MIRVSGKIKLKMPYSVVLGMTKDEFDSLSERKQNELLEGKIEWHNELKNVIATDVNIDDITEI